MNSPVSPKPSEWPLRMRRLAEILTALVLLLALSFWLSRSMLPGGETAPAETLPRLTPPNSAATADVTGHLQWPAGEEKTLVYFFAPWCTVCRVSMPSLNLLPESGLRIVAVALDWQTHAEVQEFIDRSGFRGEILLGTPDVAQRWRIDAYPSYYVINQHGTILHRDRGLSTPPGLLLRTL